MNQEPETNPTNPHEAPPTEPEIVISAAEPINLPSSELQPPFQALEPSNMPPAAPAIASEMPESPVDVLDNGLQVPEITSELPDASIEAPADSFEAPRQVTKVDLDDAPTLSSAPLDFPTLPPAPPDFTENAEIPALAPLEVVPEAAPLPAAAPEKSNLAARVITALIGIPIVALLIWRGTPSLFATVVVLLAIMSLREIGKAMKAAGTPMVGSIAYPSLLVLLLVQPLTVLNPRLGGMIIWLLPFLMMVGLLIKGVLRYPSATRLSLTSLALTLFATLYVGLFVFLILLRSLRTSPLDFLDDGPPLGYALLWLTVLSVWAGDIVAYFAGRKFGREKLTPLSPGKTWEGAIAGLVTTIAVCVPVSRLLHLELRHGLACGILIALAAPLGDLAESFWKRELQIKDMGGALPGHGGILDRCDSLLFAAFAVYLYALYFIL